ncbi:MAG: TPM domain-containing protein [Spirochaetia bacterium]|nr:TPM domain-containing protein [Spirochaetia bacterium]
MRKLFLLLLIFIASIALADDVPGYSSYVNDYAGVITEKDKTSMEEVAKEVEEKTGAQIAVLTVKSMEPYASIDEFGMAVAEKWKVGEKGKDTGIIIILAMEERKVRIEVGYGLEGIFNDARVGRILDNNIIPYFRGGDFSAGLRRGMFKIADTIGTEMNVELDERAKMQDNNFTESLCIFIFFVIFVTIFILMIRRMNNAKRTGRRYYGSSFGAMYPGYGHGRGSFGGFSSRGCGGFGGGFGGFGGGGFGGGGASRGF